MILPCELGNIVNTIRLKDYPDTPLYNIKAVVQATGITSSTLRAWERRYQVTQPQRSDSGYRLYSDRDIMLIRWLKSQVDAGMAISQAVAWLERLMTATKEAEDLYLPDTQETTPEHTVPSAHQLTTRDYTSLQHDLLHALLRLREGEAEMVLAEAFTYYPLELVGEKVITPVLIEIGERWHRGELSITHEHFATAYLQQRLTAFLRTVPATVGGALIWVGCPPNEEHEIGALLLTVYLRRAGYQVQYLGKNIPIDDLVADVQRYRPALLLFSATLEASVKQLIEMAQALSTLNGQPPIIGYGGRVFHNQPALRKQIPGIYLGDTALEAIAGVNQLLRNNLRSLLAERDHGTIENFEIEKES